MPVVIEHADGSAGVAVNEKMPPVLDKRFVTLGTYLFKASKPAVITVSNAGTDGFVAVDAVQMLPVK